MFHQPAPRGSPSTSRVPWMFFFFHRRMQNERILYVDVTYLLSCEESVSICLFQDEVAHTVTESRVLQNTRHPFLTVRTLHHDHSLSCRFVATLKYLRLPQGQIIVVLPLCYVMLKQRYRFMVLLTCFFPPRHWSMPFKPTIVSALLWNMLMGARWDLASLSHGEH